MVFAKQMGAALFALTLGATPVIASCVESDFAGRWRIYSSGWDGQTAYWVRCTVTIDNFANIRNSPCKSSTGVSATMKGAIFASSNCTFEAEFKLGNVQNNIIDAILAADHLSGNGVGAFPKGSFIFSMTKL
jgi:hypothetical protein